MAERLDLSTPLDLVVKVCNSSLPQVIAKSHRKLRTKPSIPPMQGAERVATKHCFPCCVSRSSEGGRGKKRVASSVAVSAQSDNPGKEERTRHIQV